MPAQPEEIAHVDRASRAALRLGLVIGAALSGVAIAWVLIANRFPALDRLAMLRNLAAGALVLVFMLVPVCRFRSHASHVLACGLTAWSVLTLVYAFFQVALPRLGHRMGASTFC